MIYWDILVGGVTSANSDQMFSDKEQYHSETINKINIKNLWNKKELVWKKTKLFV